MEEEMVLKAVMCPECEEIEKIKKRGKTKQGKQRFSCYNIDCNTNSFIDDYTYLGRRKDIKEKIIDMAVNGSGIRDTARVLKISINTVINTIKKKA